MAQNDYGVPLSNGLRTSVSVMAVVGAMFGQIFFGFMGDQLGRRFTFLATCLCTILGTLDTKLIFQGTVIYATEPFDDTFPVSCGN